MNTTADPRDLAFIEPKTAIAGLQLRPFSAGTMTLCRELQLTVVLGGEIASDEDKQRQLVTLLFIQSQPLETVKRAVKLARADRQAFLDDFILPFEMELPVTALPNAFAALEETFAAVNAAQFNVKSEPGAAPDPNSLSRGA